MTGTQLNVLVQRTSFFEQTHTDIIHYEYCQHLDGLCKCYVSLKASNTGQKTKGVLI